MWFCGHETHIRKFYGNIVCSHHVATHKNYVHAAFAQAEKRISIKTIFYSIFSAFFIAVGYIAAQAWKVQNFSYAIKT